MYFFFLDIFVVRIERSINLLVSWEFKVIRLFKVFGSVTIFVTVLCVSVTIFVSCIGARLCWKSSALLERLIFFWKMGRLGCAGEAQFVTGRARLCRKGSFFKNGGAHFVGAW